MLCCLVIINILTSRLLLINSIVDIYSHVLPRSHLIGRSCMHSCIPCSFWRLCAISIYARLGRLVTMDLANQVLFSRFQLGTAKRYIYCSSLEDLQLDTPSSVTSNLCILIGVFVLCASASVVALGRQKEVR